MAISFLFTVNGDATWEEGVTYYYNGETNLIEECKNPEQVASFYKTSNGRSLHFYEWDSNANSDYLRIFSCLNPKTATTKVNLNDLKAQIESYVEGWHSPRYFKAATALRVYDKPGYDGNQIGETIVGQTFKVEAIRNNYCGYDWAQVDFDGEMGWLAMSSLSGLEFGDKIRKEVGDFVGVTLSAFLAYVRSLENKAVDTDGVYGAQCVDLITHVQKKYWNFWGQGNAIDFATNPMPEGWTRGTRQAMGIKVGDILVWKWDNSDVYGHIGIVTSVNQDGSVTSMEQNVDGTLGGPSRYQTRMPDKVVSVVRPKFEEDPQAANVKPSGPPKASVPKQTGQAREYGEVGRFHVTTKSINVRRSPDPVNGEIVAKYTTGQSVRYDKVRVDWNGYVWISYIGGSGKRNWMATGETRNGVRSGAAWGRFTA